MALTEKLQILITADGRAAQQEFNKVGAAAEKNLVKTDDRLQQLSGQMVSFGATTLVAGGVAAAGLYKLAQAAGDLSESQNKANVVLGTEGAAALEQFAQGAATAAGLSERAAIDAGASFAVFGKSAGLSGQGLADFSIELTQLAGDLASFSNTTTDEAITAIGAALRGESEPIRQYGVLLDDATLKAEALSMGIYNGTGSLTQQQRVLAAQAQILKQTSDAQGDFGRTSDGLANQQRILAAEFENTKASIGEALLPTFQTLVGSLSDVAGAFNALPQGTQTAIGQVAGVGTAATIAVGGLSLLAGGAIKAVGAMRDLGAAGRVLSTTLKGGIPLAVAFGLTEVASGVINDITGNTERLNVAMGELQANLSSSAPALADFFAAANTEKLSANPFTLARQLIEDGLRGDAELANGTEVSFRNIERVINDTAASGVGALQELEDQLEQERSGINRNSQAWDDYGTILDLVQAKQAEFETGDLGRGVGAAVARANGAIEGTGDAADGSTGSVDEFGNEVDDAKEAADALKATLTKLSSVQKLSNLQFDVGAKRAEAFGESIERSTNADDLLGAAVGAGKALRGLREQLGLIPKEADKAEESSDEATKTLERLADAASAADPAVSDLGIAMDAASAGADAFNKSLSSASGLGSQLDAAVDLGSAFRDLDRSARRLPKSIDLTKIALGELRPSQMDAIADLRALGAASTDYLTAMLKTGATMDEVRGQAGLFRAELVEQLRQAGLSEEAITQYVEAAGLAPEQIETAIKLSGIESSRFKLNAYLSLLEGKIPPEVATSVIAQIEAGDLEGAATTLKNFSKTNPVDIDFTPKGVPELDEAVGKITDLPRVYDPLIAATGGYSEATLDALDAVLGLGDAYKDTLSELASTEPQKAITFAEQMREQFARTVEGLNLTEAELESYYELLGIAKPQVETAVKISISEAELFALTTTIELLTGLDQLSPEVQVRISDALLKGDYEEVRRLLETPVEVAVYGDTAPGIAAVGEWRLNEQGNPVFIPATADSNPAAQAIGIWRLNEEGDPVLVPADVNTVPTTEQLRIWREQEEAKDTTLPVGIDDSEARSEAAALFFDIGRLAPIMRVGIEFAVNAGGAFGDAVKDGADRFAGLVAGGIDGRLQPVPAVGGRDGNIYTPFAKGGRFPAGQNALVGEEGPELVTFGAAGSVLPAGPTAQLMQPTASLGSDKGQAELLAALRDLAAAQAQAAGDQITVNGAVDPVVTAEEIVRVKQANRFLAGR